MEKGVPSNLRTSPHRLHLKKMGLGSVGWQNHQDRCGKSCENRGAWTEYRGAHFRKILHERKSLWREKKKKKNWSLNNDGRADCKIGGL